MDKKQGLSVSMRRSLVKTLYGTGMSISEIAKLLDAGVQCVRNDVYRYFGAQNLPLRPTSTPDVYLKVLAVYDDLSRTERAHTEDVRVYVRMLSSMLEVWLQIPQLKKLMRPHQRGAHVSLESSASAW